MVFFSFSFMKYNGIKINDEWKPLCGQWRNRLNLEKVTSYSLRLGFAAQGPVA
jgi:hypothetical protein